MCSPESRARRETAGRAGQSTVYPVKPEPGSQSGRMGFSLIFCGVAGEQGQMRLREIVPVTLSSSVLATDISRAVLGGKRTKEVYLSRDTYFLKLLPPCKSKIRVSSLTLKLHRN